jgi:hypothetical protein
MLNSRQKLQFRADQVSAAGQASLFAKQKARGGGLWAAARNFETNPLKTNAP